jgi:hypothetical protein
MARGWESKSVEDQVAAAEAAKEARGKPQLSREDRERETRLQSLRLSRSQIMARLKTATNPKYRTQLESSLAHLNKEISELGGS